MVEFEWQKLMLDTVLALVPVLTMAVIMLIGAGFSYLRARYEWVRDLRTTQQLEDTLYALVQEANQTVVEEAKKANEDGKLTPEEARRIKEEVIRRFYATLTEEQAKILQAITADIEAWLSAKIEELVVRAKQIPFDSSRGA